MTPEQWRTIGEVFDRAVLLPAGERTAAVDRECATDDEVRSEVASLLASHQAAGGFQGTAADIEIQAKEVLRLQQRIKEILTYHTGQSMDRIARDMDRDFFMSAEIGKEYGIVDDIIGVTPVSQGQGGDGTA